jgi:Ecdysteroid kinase-like family
MVQLHAFLVPHLQELANAEGFTEGCTFTASSTGANNEQLGLILRVSIEGNRAGRGDKLSVIVKMPPGSPERRTQISAILTFAREAEFYAKFCPMLMNFQRERGVSIETDGFCAIAKCYKVIADAELQNYAMILEDLQVDGYRICNKLGTIDFAHTTLCVRNLARFHALSFAIRDQQPDLLDEIRKLKDIFYERLIDNNSHFEMAIHGALDRAIGALKPNEKFKIEKLLKLKTEAMQTFQICASHERCEPFGVLAHGDCRNNNMMYRYREVRKNIFEMPQIRLLFFLFDRTARLTAFVCSTSSYFATVPPPPI